MAPINQTMPTLSWCDFGAGWFSGIMGLLVGHPMDTIKTRSQTMPEKSVFQIIKDTFRLEGLRGFYKGLLAPMLTTGITGAVFFGVQANAYRYLREQSKEDPFTIQPLWQWDVFFSAAFAGAVGTILNAPVEAVKTRMQANAAVDSLKFKLGDECSSTWKTMKFIDKHEGIPGFFRGGLTLFLRDVPSYGVYMALYKCFKISLQDDLNLSDHLASGLAGGFSGMVSWAIVMPFDVVKSVIQSDDLNNPKYKGIIDCFRKNYKQHGLTFFIKGLTVTTIRGFFVNYVTFVTLEEYNKAICSHT